MGTVAPRHARGLRPSLDLQPLLLPLLVQPRLGIQGLARSAQTIVGARGHLLIRLLMLPVLATLVRGGIDAVVLAEVLGGAGRHRGDGLGIRRGKRWFEILGGQKGV